MIHDSRHKAPVFIILQILCYGKCVTFPGVFGKLIKILILAGQSNTHCHLIKKSDFKELQLIYNVFHKFST